MKFMSVILAAGLFSVSVARAENTTVDKVDKQIDDKANMLKGAIKKKVPKKDESKAAEPSMAQKAAAKKDELKAKAQNSAKSVQSKVEEKKAENAKKDEGKPSVQDQAKGAADKADKKADELLKKFGN